MQVRIIPIAFIAIVLSTLLTDRAIAQEPTNQAPALTITRYSELPLSEYQTRVMNEATKLSYATRMFRYLYGRWPASIHEIQGKSSGINFDVFRGQAKITPSDDDSVEISIFDGENTRAVRATPIDFQMPDDARQQSRSAQFKIEVGQVGVRQH